MVILGLQVWMPCTHAVQFRVLGWAAHDANLQFDTGRSSTEVFVFTDTFSPSYDFKGDGPISLYKRVEHEGKVRKQVACAVVIPPKLEQGLLLLIPGDDSKVADRKVLPNSFGDLSENAPLVYDYVWFDDSLTARPAGMIEFRNLSHVPISFQIEQQQRTLAPNAAAQIPMTPGARRMTFRAAAQVNSQWRVFSSNPLPTGGAERMIVILRDGPPAKDADTPGDRPNITMISLYDWPAPAKPATPALASSRR